MKHVAVLTNLYYPIMDAPSAVIDKYINSLKNDYHFHIITKTNEYLYSPSNEYDLYFISSFRHRLYQKCLYNIKNKHHILIYKIILLGVRLCMIIQNQYAFPTSRKWEVKAYYSQLKLLYEKGLLDIVIAVSDNFVTQLAMLRFKKEYPNTKCISFVLDPYTELYIYYKCKMFKSIWKKANFRKEHEVYDAADYCLFSMEMYQYVKHAFDIDPKKIFPIHFTLNRELAGNIFNNGKNPCKLVYAGGFYKNIRNPDFMLATLSNISNIYVELYVPRGECEDIISKYVSEKIVRKDVVERNEYMNILSNSCDILLNVGNNTSLQAPSKMVELLSTGKPIINFSFSKDSQYEMIQKYPLGINIMNHELNAAKIITEFCEKMKGKMMPFEEVKTLFPDNCFENQVQLLKRIIES